MTIKEIAQLAGVSRGTVDRVLHKRGRVKPEIQARIETIIRENNFSPNMVASALKRTANPMTVGVLLPSLSNPFYYDVKEGIESAAEYYSQYGLDVQVRILEGLTAQFQVHAIEELLSQGIDGLALTAINSHQMRNYINRLSEKIPIVTYNTDFVDTNRLCYVGQDYYSAGKTAGRLLCSTLLKPGKIVPLISSPDLLAHTSRVDGLREMLDHCPLDVELTEPLLTKESDEIAFDVVRNLLKNQDDVTAIFVAGGGQIGAAEALAQSEKRGLVQMYSYDLRPKTIGHLKNGTIQCTIGQEPNLQGYLPIRILYEYLVLGHHPEQEFYHTRIDIRLPENADSDGILSLGSLL